MPARKQWKFPVEINSKYTDQERQAIAIDIIDFIVKRTQNGLDKNNRKFKGPYTEGYKKSLDFKIAGKGGEVDLTLSGDMLAAIEVLKNRRGRLEIGFRPGLQNDKAEGNIIGSYGHRPNPKVARDFLGITQKDLRNEILSKYPIRDREKSLKRAEQVITATEQAGALADEF